MSLDPNQHHPATPVAAHTGNRYESDQQGHVSVRRTHSLRDAIDKKCRSCICDPFLPGRWREQVDACLINECPLYLVRPRSRASRIGESEQ